VGISAASALRAALAAAAIAAAPVTAADRGDFDSDRHPHVGLMVALDEDGAPLWRCSGTLLTPTLFLTAGHCTYGAYSVEIWFDADVESNIPDNGYPFVGEVAGTPHTHPKYDPSAFFRHDLGVVELDEPVAMPRYGRLPTSGELDRLERRSRSQDIRFTTVGYGLHTGHSAQVALRASNLRVRVATQTRLLQINVPGVTGDFAMLLSNPAYGGACLGDSGGPNFIGASDVIAGVSSFGIDGSCAGGAGVYRIDKLEDLDWLRRRFGLRP
jgi:secreted trypsin-like serine protease